jgi:nucleoside phosphorylase
MLPNTGSARVLITGIGPERARRALEVSLRDSLPAAVISGGFAGGLDPELLPGQVVCDTTDAPQFERGLRESGARPARFCSVPRVLTTVTEKAALRNQTGAQAVDMESEVIRQLCRERQLPCGIVRVISDAANQSLPLDFNLFLDRDGDLAWGRLLLALVRRPGRIGPLIRLQTTTRAAARRLAAVLAGCITPVAGPSGPR